MADFIDAQDEHLIAEIRRALARVAASLDGGGEEPENAVGAALDGAEMVMRGEVATGNSNRLPALLPGFVYLVALPVVGQDTALAMSKRCARLVEQTRG